MAGNVQDDFTEHEKRELLIEIIRATHPSIADLVALITRNQIRPAWEDTTLPNGRNLRNCKTAWDRLVGETSYLAQQRHPPPNLPLPSPRESLTHSTTYVPRDLRLLAPRPPLIPAQGLQTQPPPSSPPARKKRGRPRKTEQERERAAQTPSRPDDDPQHPQKRLRQEYSGGFMRSDILTSPAVHSGGGRATDLGSPGILPTPARDTFLPDSRPWAPQPSPLRPPVPLIPGQQPQQQQPPQQSQQPQQPQQFPRPTFPAQQYSGQTEQRNPTRFSEPSNLRPTAKPYSPTLTPRGTVQSSWSPQPTSRDVQMTLPPMNTLQRPPPPPAPPAQYSEAPARSEPRRESGQDPMEP